MLCVTPTRRARIRLLSLPCACGSVTLCGIVRVHSWPPCQHLLSISRVGRIGHCGLASRRMRVSRNQEYGVLWNSCWRSECLPCVRASVRRSSHASKISESGGAFLLTSYALRRSVVTVSPYLQGSFPSLAPTPRHSCHSVRGGDEDRPPHPKSLAPGREARRCAECCVSRRGRD